MGGGGASVVRVVEREREGVCGVSVGWGEEVASWRDCLQRYVLRLVGCEKRRLRF
jgi:hypothetical protein